MKYMIHSNKCSSWIFCTGHATIGNFNFLKFHVHISWLLQGSITSQVVSYRPVYITRRNIYKGCIKKMLIQSKISQLGHHQYANNLSIYVTITVWSSASLCKEATTRRRSLNTKLQLMSSIWTYSTPTLMPFVTSSLTSGSMKERDHRNHESNDLHVLLFLWVLPMYFCTNL